MLRPLWPHRQAGYHPGLADPPGNPGELRSDLEQAQPCLLAAEVLSGGGKESGPQRAPHDAQLLGDGIGQPYGLDPRIDRRFQCLVDETVGDHFGIAPGGEQVDDAGFGHTRFGCRTKMALT